MLMNQRVLVTGGAGFIGSNLTRALLREGHAVYCVDNLTTGSLEAVEEFKQFDGFHFVECDISDPEFLAILEHSACDRVYHLACPTGVPNIIALGEEMMRTCSTGTDNVLKLAAQMGARVVFTSSCEVYGNPDASPQTEEYVGRVDPIGDRSAYEEGKRFSEALVRLYATKYRLDAKIVRIFNTYGVGMSPADQRVIPQMLQRLREGKPMLIYGDGYQTRTYLYVDDLIAGLRLVMECGERGSVYNVGGEDELTIRDLAEVIGQLVSRFDVEYQPHFIEDHTGRMPCTAKVRRLGWEPKTDLVEGIRRMMVQFALLPDVAHR
jgi:nucleoside-diphosphate-sugar epimerase